MKQFDVDVAYLHLFGPLILTLTLVTFDLDPVTFVLKNIVAQFPRKLSFQAGKDHFNYMPLRMEGQTDRKQYDA